MTIVKTRRIECDVLVAGGGMSGLSAAIAAARAGAKTILCQDRPVLGGNASSEIRMHVVGADCSGKRCGKPLETEAREGGLIEEIRLENCVRNAQRSSSMFDLILHEMCLAEENLTLLLNATLVAATVENNRIVEATIERPSTEERFVVEASTFIDATGDGRLGAEAGAPFVEGREAGADYGEKLAQPKKDDLRLGSSLMFQARKHDRPMPFRAPAWARKFSEDDLRLRPHASPNAGHGDLGLEYGFWWVEWGGHLDTIDENEPIRDELLAIVLGVWDHIKNDGDHGAENWALDWFGFVPGKRESRRFVGQHMLTEQDVLESRPHADAIAYGGWYIDTHPPGGVDSPEEPPCTQHHVPHLYDIPLRACVSSTIENLMFAGRNMSATHIAFASTRVMATCSLMGQGVGTAAAFSAARKIAPAHLAENADAMRTIQQQLLAADCYLIGLGADDPNDLAPKAKIVASSQQTDGPARAVVSGQTRSVHGDDGAPADRAKPATHRWMSDPAEGLPATLTLEWEAPVSLDHVQLIFDSGMHRVMTLSLADSYVRHMHWGVAPPEMVRDYRIEARSGGKWRTVATIEENHQRRNVVPLDGAPLDALRIVVTATNGLDHARICEVRAVRSI